MSFSSIQYLAIFLPVAFAVYFVLNKQRYAIISNWWLLVVSLFFYAYPAPETLILILGSTITNYWLGRVIQGKISEQKYLNFLCRKRKFVLIIGIVVNVILLGYYKYTNFIVENINYLTHEKWTLPEIVFPLAISFFTFQQLAFLVDCYKAEMHNLSFLNYSLFVTFFPQLISGPIIRYNELVPQFVSEIGKKIDYSNVSKGLFVFFIGLFKKVVIADSFSIWADAGFHSAAHLTFFQAWGTSLSYTFQLYFDFSGYMDMAIGSALFFNIMIPINFNSPYKSINIQDFWRRWHITLSSWLRDYLYIPLGGNRKGNLRTYFNLITTFLIAGLWHGAGWTFVFWGAMHGSGLIIHRFWKRLNFRLPILLSWFITFLYIDIAWVFFRANTFNDAANIIKGMIGMNGVSVSKSFANLFNYLCPWSFLTLVGDNSLVVIPVHSIIYLCIFGIGIGLIMPNTMQMIQFVPYDGKYIFRPSIKYAILTGLIACLSLMTFMGKTTPNQFIYANF